MRHSPSTAPGRWTPGGRGYKLSVDEREPPPCGHCAGTGQVTYQRPRKAEDGSVTWEDSVEDCHVCGGGGLCR
ncbi:hypothetical protein GCM10027589_26260 [Actinocorallia lasiicapitis]